MFALMPFLAELGSIEKVVITALAVAGGFLVGFMLTNVIMRLLSKFVWKKEPPEKLIRIARFGGGVTAAILVYLLLTGEGGLGLGGRGGGSNKSNDDSQKAANNEEPKDEQKKKEPIPKDKTTEIRGTALTVYLLGANSPDKRFYRIGQDGVAQTLEEVVKQIEKASKNEKQSLTQVDVEVGDPDYPAQAISVLAVKLNDLGIKYTRPIVKKPSSKN